MLAQAGEGSVRDSLSALDQAIACCGTKLDAAEVRGLLGHVLARSLGEVAQALIERRLAARCWKWWWSWKRNGRSLQHFCRELARYFRNLLVVKIAGANTRLIAASQREQERLAEIAGAISRRRSDALSAADAGSVQGPAKLAAAAAASGNRAAALGPSGQAAADRRSASRSRWKRSRLRRPCARRHYRLRLRPDRPRRQAPIPNRQPRPASRFGERPMAGPTARRADRSEACNSPPTRWSIPR